MVRQERLRGLIGFRCSPLLDLALSLLVVQDPERFGSDAPWVEPVAQRMPDGLLTGLKELARRVDLFDLGMQLEAGESLTSPAGSDSR